MSLSLSFYLCSPVQFPALFLEEGRTPVSLCWSGVVRSPKTTEELKSPTSPRPGGTDWPSALCYITSDLTSCEPCTHTSDNTITLPSTPVLSVEKNMTLWRLSCNAIKYNCCQNYRLITPFVL